MALIQVGFFSQALGMCTACNVILPQLKHADEPARTFPVMTLLHGFGDNHTSWVRKTNVETVAEELGIAVVMPEVHNSSYADMVHGGKFFTYIADELPGIMRSFFPLSHRREDNFIGGCSMGGYGALKIGLLRPENYSFIASFSSGHISYRGLISRKDDRGLSLQHMTFDETGLDEEDAILNERVRYLAANGPAPRIFITVGTEDPYLLDNARATRDLLLSFPDNPFNLIYEEHPGTHSWPFWSAQCARPFAAALTVSAADSCRADSVSSR